MNKEFSPVVRIIGTFLFGILILCSILVTGMVTLVGLNWLFDLTLDYSYGNILYASTVVIMGAASFGMFWLLMRKLFVK